MMVGKEGLCFFLVGSGTTEELEKGLVA